MDKPFRVIAPWPDFNDTTGGHLFVNSVSAPMTEHEARRMAAALGGTMEAIPTIEAEDAEEVIATPPGAEVSPEPTGGGTAETGKTRSRAAGKRNGAQPKRAPAAKGG